MPSNVSLSNEAIDNTNNIQSLNNDKIYEYNNIVDNNTNNDYQKSTNDYSKKFIHVHHNDSKN